MPRMTCFVLAVVAFLVSSVPPAQAAEIGETVWVIVNDERHAAERLQGYLWHVVTQGAWPATMALQVEWLLPKAAYECSAVSISSEDPQYLQEGVPERQDVDEWARRYLYTAYGVKTNRSIVKSEVYRARFNCSFGEGSTTLEVLIRVDANATATFDPGLTGNQSCVEFLAPRDGGQVALEVGNQLSVKSLGSTIMSLQVERAAKVETGMVGDLSLPPGQIYVSEWAIVHEGLYDLPKEGMTLNVRYSSPGGTKAGLYRARAWCLKTGGFSVDTTPWSPWIQYRVGNESVQVGKSVAQAEPKALKLPAPRLQVKSIASNPAPHKAGTPVNLEIAFENRGDKASAPDAKYRLACTVLTGGPECPVPSREGAIGKGIAPGQTGSVQLLGARPAEAGDYRVSVAVPPDQPGRPFSIVLKVAPPARKSVGPTVAPHSQPAGQRPRVPMKPLPDGQKPVLK